MDKHVLVKNIGTAIRHSMSWHIHQQISVLNAFKSDVNRLMVDLIRAEIYGTVDPEACEIDFKYDADASEYVPGDFYAAVVLYCHRYNLSLPSKAEFAQDIKAYAHPSGTVLTWDETSKKVGSKI